MKPKTKHVFVSSLPRRIGNFLGCCGKAALSQFLETDPDVQVHVNVQLDDYYLHIHHNERVGDFDSDGTPPTSNAALEARAAAHKVLAEPGA